MAEFNPRDKSRTSPGKTRNMVRLHTSPPKSEAIGDDILQRWQWITVEMMESPAFRTMSANASKMLFRIILEHQAHGALENGKLIVTHGQFVEYGVTGEYVADAAEELHYKGLVKVHRGRAGTGTSHPNVFRLTFVGDHEGAPATNDWRRITMEHCRRWSEVDRKIAADKRAKYGRKKNSPLRDSEMRPLRDSEMRKAG